VPPRSSQAPPSTQPSAIDVDLLHDRRVDAGGQVAPQAALIERALFRLTFLARR